MQNTEKNEFNFEVFIYYTCTILQVLNCNNFVLNVIHIYYCMVVYYRAQFHAHFHQEYMILPTDNSAMTYVLCSPHTVESGA